MEDAGERSEFEGRIYYFCSDQCRNRFDENPALFASNLSEEKGSVTT